MSGGIVGLFLVLFVKIGISDVIRGIKIVKGNIEENRRIVKKM